MRDTLATLRSKITEKASGQGSFSLLSDVGLSTTKDGLLTFDSSKLSAALSKDEAGVRSLLAAGAGDTGGFADRISSYLTGITGTDGILTIRNNALSSELTDLSDRIAAGQRTVAAYQENLQQTFTSLETLVSSLQSQGNFLLSTLGKG